MYKRVDGYGLCVVGGGLSGVCAAIAAARQGTKVLLVEKTNALGGAAVVNLVNPFMPYTTNIDGKVRSLSKGIFMEISNELGCLDHKDGGRHVSYTFDEEQMKIVLNRMCLESGVQLLFGAYLCGCDRDGNKIKSITVSTVAGSVEIVADYFIDATGDGTLFMHAGCPYHLGRAADSLCQPMTLCFRAAGINKEEFFKSRGELNKLYKEYRAEGKIKNPREDILSFKTVHDGVVHFNTTRVVKLDPTDPFDVTRAEIEAREQVYEVIEFMREHSPACKNIKLLSTAIGIGVRESRMVDGEHVLNEMELKECTRFEDSIALGNYDIDIHNPEGTGTSHYYFKAGEYYTIPYRSLIPKGMENLLVVGRCISATHEAQASIRIMPIIACIGEAGGVAVAVAGKDGVGTNALDVSKVQKILSETNCEIF